MPASLLLQNHTNPSPPPAPAAPAPIRSHRPLRDSPAPASSARLNPGPARASSLLRAQPSRNRRVTVAQPTPPRTRPLSQADGSGQGSPAAPAGGLRAAHAAGESRQRRRQRARASRVDGRRVLWLAGGRDNVKAAHSRESRAKEPGTTAEVYPVEPGAHGTASPSQRRTLFARAARRTESAPASAALVALSALRNTGKLPAGGGRQARGRAGSVSLMSRFVLIRPRDERRSK